ncbi:hypothetical protein J3F83DRAFT_63554 [Trichoderma novae-zelandiae]
MLVTLVTRMSCRLSLPASKAFSGTDGHLQNQFRPRTTYLRHRTVITRIVLLVVCQELEIRNVPAVRCSDCVVCSWRLATRSSSDSIKGNAVMAHQTLFLSILSTTGCTQWPITRTHSCHNRIGHSLLIESAMFDALSLWHIQYTHAARTCDSSMHSWDIVSLALLLLALYPASVSEGNRGFRISTLGWLLAEISNQYAASCR